MSILSITTTALSQRLCKISEAKSYLNIASTVTTYNSLLGQIIDEASNAIDIYLDRTLAFQVYSEKAQSYDSPWLRLTNAPVVTSSSAVTVTQTRRGSTNSTTISSSLYEVQSDHGMLYNTTHWRWSAPIKGDYVFDKRSRSEDHEYTVGYSAGYDLRANATASTLSTASSGFTQPGALKRAALLTVRDWFNDLSIASNSTEFKTFRTLDAEVQNFSPAELNVNSETGDALLPEKAEAILSKFILDI